MATIGIDLGTTNSLVACWKGNGPVIIPNAFGVNLTPSVVSIDDTGEILVGQIAKERLITHPHLTAAAFKRFMGTEKRFELGEYSFLPEELSSFVLRALKEDAEAFFGYPVEDAVISVPAYFNDNQRKATKRAAELAGLNVERLVNEPTAAALSYGLHKKESETTFMVFDLGGGTFDVSILELYEGIMEVRAIAGDNFLGGEDFTEALVSHFTKVHNIDKEALSLKIKSAVYKQAELCKYALSQDSAGKMSLVMDGKTYETDINCNDFENISNQLILRLRNPIDRALGDASIHPKDLNAVILMGGATRMPIIKSAVSKIFRQPPYSNINPDEAVALGAAIQAALKEKNEALKEVILTDVCPYTLGTSVSRGIGKGKHESGYFLPIIQRNTSIPVSRVERLYTIVDNQSKIKVDVYQGENRRVTGNLKLGEITVDVPPAPAGEQPIDVRYTYDINGILEVEVITVKTGTKNKIVIENNPGCMSQEEIEERLNMLESIKIHPRECAENRLLIAKGERLYEETLGESRDYIDYLLNRFERVLATQNERDIKNAAKEFKEEIEKIERKWGY